MGVLINRTDEYYKKRIEPEKRLESEVTISHLMRSKNSFTASGLPYGTIIARQLKKYLPKNPRILEIGPGLGDLAENFTQELNGSFSYTFIDISKDFISFLKKRFSGDNRFNFIIGDFLTAGFKGKFNLIICNEVFGDLPTIINVRKNARHRELRRIAKKYKLKLKDGVNFNYGAVIAIEKIRKILARHGTAFICEHGCEGEPKKILAGDHFEYTIDFSTLKKVSKSLGFSIKYGSLTEFLGIKKLKCVLFMTQHELKMIRQFLKEHGVFIENRIYTIDEVMSMLSRHVKIHNPEKYRKFLLKNSKCAKEITNQFRFLILKNQ
ncbi:MAG: class I SAM-dependent methyltransferase [Candidatus Aenigmarchaeota archaeon]|nr:class I SAM-dependent methyltransferase [Candidatus Aenigmarchaeota archaeon]